MTYLYLLPFIFLFLGLCWIFQSFIKLWIFAAEEFERAERNYQWRLSLAAMTPQDIERIGRMELERQQREAALAAEATIIINNLKEKAIKP